MLFIHKNLMIAASEELTCNDTQCDGCTCPSACSPGTLLAVPCTEVGEEDRVGEEMGSQQLFSLVTFLTRKVQELDAERHRTKSREGAPSHDEIERLQDDLKKLDQYLKEARVEAKRRLEQLEQMRSQIEE